MWSTACACRIARRPERERVIDDWESLCWSVVGLGLCHWVGNLKTVKGCSRLRFRTGAWSNVSGTGGCSGQIKGYPARIGVSAPFLVVDAAVTSKVGVPSETYNCVDLLLGYARGKLPKHEQWRCRDLW